MTTTELIELLKKHERGGATGRPREVMFEANDRIIGTDGIEVTGSGDGLISELYLSLPSAQPEGLKDKLDDAYAHGYTAAEAKYRKWIEKFDRIIRELGVNCAYDMPSFWCNQGKDYKVIPTKYHKGYMQALADVEERMKGAEE